MKSERKQSKNRGFVLSIIVNMLFRTYWLVLVCILVLMHFLANWPLWLIVIPLVCWFVHSLVITLVLGWANSKGSVKARPEPKNVNPYSYKKQDEQNPDH